MIYLPYLLISFSPPLLIDRNTTTTLFQYTLHVQSCELNALPTRLTPNQTCRQFAVALHVSGHYVCGMEVDSINQSMKQTCTLVVDHKQAKLFTVEEDTKSRGEVEDFFHVILLILLDLEVFALQPSL